MADEATLLVLVQRQLQAERELRTMVEEEAANALERFEHEQVYQQHCQAEVSNAEGWQDGSLHCGVHKARQPTLLAHTLGPGCCRRPTKTMHCNTYVDNM